MSMPTLQSSLFDVMLHSLFDFKDIICLSPTNLSYEQPLFIMTLGQTPDGACFRRCLIRWAEKITQGPWKSPRVELFARHVFAAQDQCCVMDYIALAEARDDCRVVYTFPYFKLQITVMVFVRSALAGAIEVCDRHDVRLPWREGPLRRKLPRGFTILDEIDLPEPDDETE